MLCPNCRQEIEAGSEFCGNCGARIECLPVEQACPACGSPLLPGAEFCAECGAKLTVETVPVPVFCPDCGAAVQPGNSFCVECGARVGGEPIPAPAFCPECGAAVEKGDTFCLACGAKLTASAAAESRQSFQLQMQLQPKSQPQDWSPQQQDWTQPQVQGKSAQVQQQKRSVSSLLQGSGQRKMLMAAAAAVVLLVIGITGFWKPGFLLDLFRSTAKLENGVLALNDISLDFKQTNLKDGAATLTTVKDKEEEVQNGLIGDLYVMKIDKSCQGKVTVSVLVPKDFKPTNGDGLYIKLGVGLDYVLADGKTARYYSYFDTTVKDGKAVAVIDPAALGQGRRKFKTSAKPAEEEKPDLGEFTEHVGVFYWKQIGNIPKVLYGEGYEYSKGHFRVWYNYNVQRSKNVYMGGDEAQRLLSDLEEAYNYYKTHGYKEHVDTYTPIDVYITRISAGGDEGGWDPLTGNMQIKESSMFGLDYNLRYDGDQRTKTKATIYHEVFHAVQQSLLVKQSLSGYKDYANDSKKNNWFDEATATHFEKLVIPDAVSENGKSNFWRLWGGPIPKESSTADGYARGLLIDYMSSKQGNDDWIKDCYEQWSGDHRRFKFYMRLIDEKEADFAAKFYMEVVRKLGKNHASFYYSRTQVPDRLKEQGEDRYLSAIKLKLDDKTKEKIAKGEEDATPVLFTSPPLEIEGYGGYLVALVTRERNTQVNLTDSFPDKCQLKLEAEGCRIQPIRFRTDSNDIVTSNDTIIKDFKEQINKGYRFLVLVTSTQPTKQNVVLKATLEVPQLKEGIYNGKATMTEGKKTQTTNNGGFFRLSQSKDGRWCLNICDANGDYAGETTNVPFTYDAKQKVWKGHRKYKLDVSRNPDRPKIETGEFNCTMRVNLEGKEPVLIIDYKAEGINWRWGIPMKENWTLHFEGKWVSELKGRNTAAKEDEKAIILE